MIVPEPRDPSRIPSLDELSRDSRAHPKTSQVRTRRNAQRSAKSDNTSVLRSRGLKGDERRRMKGGQKGHAKFSASPTRTSASDPHDVLRFQPRNGNASPMVPEPPNLPGFEAIIEEANAHLQGKALRPGEAEHPPSDARGPGNLELQTGTAVRCYDKSTIFSVTRMDLVPSKKLANTRPRRGYTASPRSSESDLARHCKNMHKV